MHISMRKQQRAAAGRAWALGALPNPRRIRGRKTGGLTPQPKRGML